MTLKELQDQLGRNKDKSVRIQLPDGTTIPDQLHITEVGHVSKSFIDCGGTLRHEDTVLLQLWLGRDAEHRLTTSKIDKILSKARTVVPNDSSPVDVEYQTESVSQYSVQSCFSDPFSFTIELKNKHTDCLAKEQCRMEQACCSAGGC